MKASVRETVFIIPIFYIVSVFMLDKEDLEGIREHGCGMCGRLSCTTYGMSGDDTCPFHSPDWNPVRIERVSRAMVEKGRTGPVERDVSPCSENTRVTLETVMEDPLMRGSSAAFEPHTMGTLLRSSALSEVKWSEELGYGKCILEGDTSLLIQSKGKIVIRRALHKEGALSWYGHLRDLILPSIFLSDSGITLHESIWANTHPNWGRHDIKTVRGMYRGLLNGIYGDLSADRDRTISGYCEEYVRMSPPVSELMESVLAGDEKGSNGSIGEKYAKVQRSLGMLTSSLKEKTVRPEVYMGEASLHLHLMAAISYLQRFADGGYELDDELKDLLLRSTHKSDHLGDIMSVLSDRGPDGGVYLLFGAVRLIAPPLQP